MLLVFFCCEQPIIKVIFKPKKGDEENEHKNHKNFDKCAEVCGNYQWTLFTKSGYNNGLDIKL